MPQEIDIVLTFPVAEPQKPCIAESEMCGLVPGGRVCGSRISLPAAAAPDADDAGSPELVALCEGDDACEKASSDLVCAARACREWDPSQDNKV